MCIVVHHISELGPVGVILYLRFFLLVSCVARTSAVDCTNDLSRQCSVLSGTVYTADSFVTICY